MKDWSGCSSEAEGVVLPESKWAPLKAQDSAVVVPPEEPVPAAVAGGSPFPPSFFACDFLDPREL